MSEYRPIARLPKDLDSFTRGYLECAEWCGIDDSPDTDLLESNRVAFELSVSPEWSPDAIAQAIEDCAAFQQANADDLAEADDDRAGHDFWLTRNRHGAGFWDGDYPEAIGRRLTDAAHAYGELSVWFDADAELLRFEG
jgi:hypothetical protein